MTITPQSAYGTAKFIVSATPGQGNYTTLAAAVTASSSGDTIFVRPGTYAGTALKAGVNITAYTGDSDLYESNVTILGKCTFSTAGIVTISNINLKTNNDYCLSITGSAASQVQLNNCNIDANNHTAIEFSSSNSSSFINLNNCTGNIDTTGIEIYSHTSTGGITFNYCFFINNGGSTTPSSNSAGLVNCHWSQFFSSFSTSSTGAFSCESCVFECAGINTACITTAGSASGQVVRLSRLSSGTASAISIGTGTTISCDTSVLNSSNTDVIAGSGTLNYGAVTCEGSSTLAGTLTVNPFTTIPSSGGGSGITTIDGDSGSITGSTVTIRANNSSNNCGSSVSFANSSSTSTLNVTDSSNNTFIGLDSGNSGVVSGGGINSTCLGYLSGNNLSNGSQYVFAGYGCGRYIISGSNSVGIGYLSLNGTNTSSPFNVSASDVAIGYKSMTSITNSSSNVAVGQSTLQNLLTGSNNVIIGSNTGYNYSGSESYNIIIGTNINGTASESNTLRIGAPPSLGQGITTTYIAGITGATPTSGNTPQVVLCDNIGNLAVISSSTSGYILTSNGTSTPSFQALSQIPFTITSVIHSASPYTVLSTDQYLAVNVSGGVVTIKLPNAPTTGRVIHIKDSNGLAATSNISITTVGGSVTIDGQTTYTMATNYQSVSVIFNGTNYEVF